MLVSWRRLIARDHLGSPQSSSDAFMALRRAGIISETVSRAMVAMVGFRIIAIHQYQPIGLAVIPSIAQERWRDLVAFCRELGLEIIVETA